MSVAALDLRLRPDPQAENQVAEHADDLHRVIAAVSRDAPVDIFASSGGAVNALAFARARRLASEGFFQSGPPAQAARGER